MTRKLHGMCGHMLRVFVACFVFGTVGFGASVPNDTVVMSPFVVEGQRVVPEYLYCELPGFRVLSLGSEAETREILSGLQEMLRLYSVLVPEDLWMRYTRPTLLILNPHGNTTPGVPAGPGALINSRVNLNDSDTRCFQLRYGRGRAYDPHRNGHYAARLQVTSPDHEARPLPYWVMRALNQLTLAIGAPNSHDPDRVTFGRDSARLFFPYSRLNPPSAWLHLKFEEVFPRNPDPFIERTPATLGINDHPFLLQFAAWALLYPKEEPRAAMFWDFVRRAPGIPATEQMLVQSFGFNFEELKARMARQWKKDSPDRQRFYDKPDYYHGGHRAQFRLPPLKDSVILRRPSTAERVFFVSAWTAHHCASTGSTDACRLRVMLRCTECQFRHRSHEARQSQSRGLCAPAPCPRRARGA